MTTAADTLGATRNPASIIPKIDFDDLTVRKADHLTFRLAKPSDRDMHRKRIIETVDRHPYVAILKRSGRAVPQAVVPKKYLPSHVVERHMHVSVGGWTHQSKDRRRWIGDDHTSEYWTCPIYIMYTHPAKGKVILTSTLYSTTAPVHGMTIHPDD